MLIDQELINKVNSKQKHCCLFLHCLCNLHDSYFSECKRKLEEWFLNYPEEHKYEIKQRFYAVSNDQFWGAYFELMLHQYLVDKGFEVCPHEPVEGRNIDFLVKKEGNDLFYLEVFAIIESDERLKQKLKMEEIFRKIENQCQKEINADISFKGELTNNIEDVPISEICAWLAREEGESYKEFSTGEGSLNIDKYDRTEYTLKRFSYSYSYSGSVGGRSFENALESKRSKYKKLRLPFVVAACSFSAEILNEYDVETHLFGRKYVSIDPRNPDDSEWRRVNKGFFVPLRHSNEWKVKNTSLSALLFCCRGHITELNKQSFEMRVYHHWDPKKKLSHEYFLDIPQLVYDKDPKGGVSERWLNDNRQVVVF